MERRSKWFINSKWNRKTLFGGNSTYMHVRGGRGRKCCGLFPLVCIFFLSSHTRCCCPPALYIVDAGCCGWVCVGVTTSTLATSYLRVIYANNFQGNDTLSLSLPLHFAFARHTIYILLLVTSRRLSPCSALARRIQCFKLLTLNFCNNIEIFLCFYIYKIINTLGKVLFSSCTRVVYYSGWK